MKGRESVSYNIISVCIYSKYARWICSRTQWKICVTSSITMKIQAASSTAVLNISIILIQKFTREC